MAKGAESFDWIDWLFVSVMSLCAVGAVVFMAFVLGQTLS